MDPLKILNIEKGATLSEVKRQYRKLCLKYHPDKNFEEYAEERYIQIQEAFSAIKNDPNILTQEIPQKNIFEYIRLKLNITLEDIYFCREKKVEYEREIYCKYCDGTGSSEKQQGICDYCNGKGRLNNDILNLLKRDTICPVCNGSGIKGKICKICKGHKKIREKTEQTFRVNLRSYYKKTHVIKNAGNQIGRQNYSDVIIKFKILLSSKIFIEDNYFTTTIDIHPIQKIIGDKSILEIYGRRIPFKINIGENEVIVRDQIGKKFYRDICIKFNEIMPDPTKETRQLYKRILEIEKNITH